jgi:hypothetical protein
MADDLGYSESVDWQIGMNEFRRGRCSWCKEDIDKCGTRTSLDITCVYGEVIIPVLFILDRQGWLKKWLDREGYNVAFGVAQL